MSGLELIETISLQEATNYGIAYTGITIFCIFFGIGLTIFNILWLATEPATNKIRRKIILAFGSFNMLLIIVGVSLLLINDAPKIAEKRLQPSGKYIYKYTVIGNVNLKQIYTDYEFISYDPESNILTIKDK